MEPGISAILIASTMLVALVPILISQVATSNLPNPTTAKRLLVGSFCCGVIAIALAISWFFSSNALLPVFIAILFFAQIMFFTLVAIAFWLH